MNMVLDVLTAFATASAALTALLGALHRLGLRWPSRRSRPRRRRASARPYRSGHRVAMAV